ncbi:MAG: UbiA family prenyltransferase [Verrucomicrobiota bacterium]
MSWLRDWLAMGRVANLPTIVSNVMLGCGLGIFVRSWEFEIWRLVVPCVVGCLLYLGGCFLNDWWDCKWDAVNKPERALPSGRVARWKALLATVFCWVAAAGLSVLLGWAVFGVVVGVIGVTIGFTVIHHATALSAPLMGLCRGMLYVIGFLGQEWSTSYGTGWVGGASEWMSVVTKVMGLGPELGGDLILKTEAIQGIGIPALGLVAFISGLSMFIRAENLPVVPRGKVVLGIALMAFAALTHTVSWMKFYPGLSVGALLVFVAFLVWGILRVKSSVRVGVSWLLATVALVDLVMALPLGVAFSRAHGSFSLFEGAVFPLVSVLAFGLALVLQRVAPAT